MSDAASSSFRIFLAAGLERGGFETDDTLVALLPLMRQVVAAHAEGRVAPLRGLAALTLSADNGLSFDPAKLTSPQRQTARVEQLQTAVSRAVEVIGRAERTADIDAGTLQVKNLEVGQ